MLGFILFFWMAFVISAGLNLFLVDTFGIDLLLGQPVWYLLTLISGVAGALTGLAAWTYR